MNSRRQYLPGNLEGPDVDIETSLKEYGLAWIETDTDILFYYGINHNDEEYFMFDFCSLDKDIDILDDYDWVNFNDIYSFVGMSEDEWNERPFTSKIEDLMSYYGYENVFGSSYWEGLTYQQILMSW